MALGPFEPSLKRMRAAVDLLEAAVERRMRRDAKRGVAALCLGGGNAVTVAVRGFGD